MDRWNVNTGYTLEQFRVNEENLQAFQAAEAAAMSPGNVHNPLLLYGPAGMGKTHLLHAVGNRILQEDPELRVIYLTAGELAKQWTEDFNGESVKDLENVLKSADVLLFDDFDRLDGKMLVQEVLLRALETLQENGRQIVLAAVSAPQEQHGLMYRLQARVSCGLAVHLRPYDMSGRTGKRPSSPAKSLPEQEDLWQRVLSEVKQKIDPDAFATWFIPAMGKETEEGLEIVAPNEFSCDWLEFRYGTLISDTVNALTQKKPSVRFSVLEGENGGLGALDGNNGSYSSVRRDLRSIRQLTERLLVEQQRTNAMLERLCAEQFNGAFSFDK